MRFVLFAATLLFSFQADAMDLRERVGVGFSNQFASLSSLSVRYHLPTRSPTIRLAVELSGGVSIMNSQSAAITQDGWFGGARVLYGFVAEDNMTLYAAAGTGFTSSGSDQAVRLQPALGAEFFLYGLENLGISTEWGLNVDMGNTTRVHSVSGGPGVSVHYYF